MAIQLLPPPPSTSPIISPIDKKSLNMNWIIWLDKLHVFMPNSNRNTQSITGAIAVNANCNYINLSSNASGTYAITLEAPTVPNLEIVIEMINFTTAKTVTMALTNVIGGTASTTCTWNGTNQALILKSLATKWCVYKQQGVTLT
jgi:hypothetical protein